MIPMFKQELDQMGKGKPKTSPVPGPDKNAAEQEVLDAEPTVQGETEEEVLPNP